ncbi:unnamed protein product [Allacma fusca]|uniref:Tetraspanin n=1 Tax=Allacma fusca TaxID=39272 RepID=A0A8J2PF25_9HEXA|nr:unnamed protein product [Allacma fusca]
MTSKRITKNKITPDIPEENKANAEFKQDANPKNPRLSEDPAKNTENRRKSIDPNNVGEAVKGRRGTIPHDGNATEIAAAKMAEQIEKEKERQIRKGIMKKEKELQKKLAHHQHDKNKNASEEQLYVAPPAPQNKISVVKIISCGYRGYRRCLLVCGLILLLDLIVQVGLAYFIVIWPMGFGRLFERIKTGGVTLEIKLYFTISITVVLIVWLSLSGIFATTTRFCCWKNSTYWCIRGYYAYSVYLLIIPVFGFLSNILYIGRFDLEELEITMERHLNTYDAIDISKEFWDETQIYLECCGVDDDGWRDWKYRDKVQEDVDEWIVPESCCRKGLSKDDQIKCTNETTDELVWEGGCSTRLYNLYYIYTSLLVTTFAVTILFHVLSVYYATRIYEAVREAQDPTFKFHKGIYFLECCSCCRHCRPVEVVYFVHCLADFENPCFVTSKTVKPRIWTTLWPLQQLRKLNFRSYGLSWRKLNQKFLILKYNSNVPEVKPERV